MEKSGGNSDILVVLLKLSRLISRDTKAERKEGGKEGKKEGRMGEKKKTLNDVREILIHVKSN